MIPAIVTAGEGRASRAVYGESKVYLEIAGRTLVEHVVATLQHVPEISEVWVVGNPERLETVLGRDTFQSELRKPLHIVAQRRNLLENCWEAYRRALPGAGPEGRDPVAEDADFTVLFVSGDLPLAQPQEISDFIRRSRDTGCDYALGLVPEEALLPFRPKTPSEPGIKVATFNIRDGRLRQSNLHYVKPARLGNRPYIEEMYEHRYQRHFGNMVALAWRLLREERGGPSTVFYFLVIHVAGFLDRIGLRRLADMLRPIVNLEMAERQLSLLLRTNFRFVITEVGGCGVDVDSEGEYDAIVARFEEWEREQAGRAAELLGPPQLPAHSESAGGGTEP